jgi:hypothetical protein
MPKRIPVFGLVAGLALTAVLLLVGAARDIGILDLWGARATPGLDDPKHQGDDGNQITVLGNASVLYTVPDDRDLLMTDFCTNDKSMYLTMNGKKLVAEGLSGCGAWDIDLLIHGGEALGCEGPIGTCTFSGVLATH